MQKKKPSAFTLIEVLFVLFIIGLVLSASVPAIYRAFTDAKSTQAVANSLTLNQAAERARIRGLSGPGTFGSDKAAALSWYFSNQIISQSLQVSLVNISFLNGAWLKNEFSSDANEVNVILANTPTLSTTQVRELSARIPEFPFSTFALFVSNSSILTPANAPSVMNALADASLNNMLPTWAPSEIQNPTWLLLNYGSTNNLLNVMNAAAADFTGRDLAGMSLVNSNVTALQISTASNLNGVNLTGTGVTRAQLQALGILPVTLDSITFSP